MIIASVRLRGSRSRWRARSRSAARRRRSTPSRPGRSYVAQQVEAQRVGSVAVDHRERVEHVAKRLAHLLAVHQQITVHEHRFGNSMSRPSTAPASTPCGNAGCPSRSNAHRRARTPRLGPRLSGVGERGVVVRQRVKPHVEDMLFVPRYGHAPCELVAGERHVAEAD